MKIRILFVFLFFAHLHSLQAQEFVAPLNYNPWVKMKVATLPVKKTTTLTLPFFDDFTGYDPIPDNSKWMDRSTYINNTMGWNPISRGVVTFDALNAQGAPYDSINPFHLLYADSLTSLPIDLSINTPGDSIYLSFFFQPQGNGFAPDRPDSLMLYFKNSTDKWIKVWATTDSTLRPFKQVMIGVTDNSFFHAGFQFRFVNKASINLNDDIWNVDYVRMNAGRNINDTAINDITTTIQPTNLLNDLTSMPYRHFKANTNKELATQHSFWGMNWFNTQQSVVYGYQAREANSNTVLFSGTTNNGSLGSYASNQYTFPTYSPNYTSGNPYQRVVFENKYFLGNPATSDPKINDTIIFQQIFDNYLAYDDGTAEKSYFLKQFATLPAKTAIEFHLNQPDTLRGIAIYFGRQVPMAFSKFFDVTVYGDIAVNGGSNNILYTNPASFLPGYVDTINHFWNYRFDTLVALPAGTFYVGTTQPAQSGSDSLYFGLDVNRVGGNHLYVDYQGFWQPSVVQGALMIRPLLGQPIIGTEVQKIVSAKQIDWSVFPNPSNQIIQFALPSSQNYSMQILDLQGRTLITQKVQNGERVDISKLAPGMYFTRLLDNEQNSEPKKIIKY
ncbi:MAG: T9SS type A sorting domain-containing protein [Bacteroidetes bacterium]|nr:T9SS type A sorting domain-containing protein [Bacteroidota bacterium]